MGRRSFLVLAAGLLSLLAGARAGAVSFPLNVEFDASTTGNFGTVTVAENAGELDIAISLTTVLGSDPDLHEFYFNLDGSFTNVGITDTDAPNTSYTITGSPMVVGAAGASFDYEVNFGNGGGTPGNGRLQFATFTLFADQWLTLSALLGETSTTNLGAVVNVAAHVQNTEFVQGADSETVGGQVPEPSTALLVAGGMLMLAAHRRAARR